MAKKLSIKGGDHQRLSVHHRLELLQLFEPLLDIAQGVAPGRAGRCCRVIGQLAIEGAVAAADAAQLEPEGATAEDASGLQLLLRQLPADVPVKLAVGGIPWITITGGPDRQRGFAVTAEESH